MGNACRCFTTGTSTVRSMIRFEMTLSCGANFITATVFSRIDSGTSTSTICSTIQSGTRSWHRNVYVALHGPLFDLLLWSGSEASSANFADVVNFAQLATWFSCLQRIPKRKSLGLSLSKTVCFLFSVLSLAERSILSILMVDSRRRFDTGTSTVVSMY